MILLDDKSPHEMNDDELRTAATIVTLMAAEIEQEFIIRKAAKYRRTLRPKLIKPIPYGR